MSWQDENIFNVFFLSKLLLCVAVKVFEKATIWPSSYLTLALPWGSSSLTVLKWQEMTRNYISNINMGYVVYCLNVKESYFLWSLFTTQIISRLSTMSSSVIPAWISKYIDYKVWDELTFPFPNFNGVEWIINYIPYFIKHVIT